MEWIVIPIVLLLGMIGGQAFKAVRRYGIPLASVAFGAKKKTARTYALLLLGVVLSMGYGEDSKINELLGGKDWVVRLVYGLMLGAVVAVAGFIWSLLLMPLAFLFRCNWSFKIGKYDWLWEDFVRYLTLGVCIWRTIL